MTNPGWPLAPLAVAGLLVSGGVTVLWLFERGDASTSARPCAQLRTLHQAQGYYREKSGSSGGTSAYWRTDIAGLYAGMIAGRDPLKLIPLALAAADDRPKVDLSPYAVRSPLAGYWLRALPFDDEKELGPDRFAGCAFADSLDVDGWAYLITHQGVLWRRRRASHEDRPETCPRDPASAGWQRVD